MKKNYIKKILLIIVILSFTFFITYIGTKSSYAQEIIDKLQYKDEERIDEIRLLEPYGPGNPAPL